MKSSDAIGSGRRPSETNSKYECSNFPGNNFHNFGNSDLLRVL